MSTKNEDDTAPQPQSTAPMPTVVRLTFDVSTLPRLGTTDFLAILDWKRDVLAALRPHRTRPWFDAALLVDADIVDAWALMQNDAVANFPTDIDRVADQLSRCFAPKNAEERLAILRRQRLVLPEPGSGTPYILAVSRHATSFAHCAAALMIPVAAAAKIYVAALPGRFGRLVIADLELTQLQNSLTGVTDAAKARARAFDDA